MDRSPGEAVAMIPEPEALDAAWLAAQLADEACFKSASPTKLHIQPTPIQGLGGRVFRLHLDYGDVAGPATMIAKFHASDAVSRKIHSIRRMYATEVQFYVSLAASVPVRVPHCHFASVSESGDSCLILLEDIPFAPQTDRIGGLSLNDARLLARTAAHLHASFWGNTAQLKREEWLLDWKQMLERETSANEVQAPTRIRPAIARARLNEIIRRLSELPHTLLHGDLCGKNLLLAESGEAVLDDWQFACRGPAVLDVANLTALSAPPGREAQFVGELLRTYHTELLATGVVNSSFSHLRSQCVDALRLHLARHETLRAVLVPGSEAEEFVRLNVERFAAALYALDANP